MFIALIVVGGDRGATAQAPTEVCVTETTTITSGGQLDEEVCTNSSPEPFNGVIEPAFFANGLSEGERR